MTWIVLTSFCLLLSNNTYAAKSRQRLRKERHAREEQEKNNRYTTTVCVDTQDSNSVRNANLSELLTNEEPDQKDAPELLNANPTPSAGAQPPTPPAPIAQAGIAPQNAIEPPIPPQQTPSLIIQEKKIDQAVQKAEQAYIPLPEIPNLEPEKDIIEFHFEDADLEQLVNQIEQLFDVTFIRDDMLNPLPQDAKAIKGNKISFKTQQALTKQQAWNLFLIFLRLAGFSVIPQPNPRLYRIILSDASNHYAANKAPVPSFIGTDVENLPDNDQVIRYVYFVQNTNLDTIESVINELKSHSAVFAKLPDIKAFLMVDQAYNIKSLMRIVKELDKVTMPQSMSVLKLHKADAEEVQKLYASLMKQEDAGAKSRLFPRKKPTARYFPENVRMISEPRTNSLILLGPQEAIKKIETFIIENVDVDIERPYSPLKVYTLKYADAVTIAKIMSEVVAFGKGTSKAAEVGGVRGGDKYLNDLTFTPEIKTNRLIIKGEYEEYMKAIDIIKKLDAPQPQVAMEVLILSVTLVNNKQLGAQLRSRKYFSGEGLSGKNVDFQTSGLFGGTAGIVENPDGPGVDRLLGNLINLVTGAPAGNTIVTLGQDVFGVWGVLQALETVANTQILANPFLVATNKAKAHVKVGEVRRVVTGTIIGTAPTQTLDDMDAYLEVDIVPQINSDGMIMLNLTVSLVAFTANSTQVNVAQTTREVKTVALVADREVLALGGLIRSQIQDNLTKWPLLGDIPVLGWLFKNKSDAQTKDNLLILISARIIEPRSQEQAQGFTHERIAAYRGDLNEMHDISERHDPIHHMFFQDRQDSAARITDEFLFKRHHEMLPLDEPKKPKDKKPELMAHAQTIQAEKNKGEFAQQTVATNGLQAKLQRKSKNSLTSLVNTSGAPVT